MAAARLVPLAMTERQLPADAEAVGEITTDEDVGVTVYVRRRPDQLELPDPDEVGSLPGLLAAPVDDDEFSARYGADPGDLDRVVAFAEKNQLEVVETSAEKRSVQLHGPARAVQSAFGVTLKRYSSAGRTFRGRTGAVHVPPELAEVVESVFGLDDRQVGASRLRRNPRLVERVALSTARATGLPQNTFLPPAVANLYRFPPGTDGADQCIAILNFNDPTSHGGYAPDAIKIFFEQVLGLPVPDVTDVVVHGQGNDPGSDDGSDPADTSAEVMLDLQMVGGIAPRAKIVMYFTQFTEQGWVDAVNAIITDTTHRPTVISVSYGNPEDDPRSAWTASAIHKVNEAFRAAAARGITICCASGDDGSRDQAGDGLAHADFPASSPYVLACGGTRVFAPFGTLLGEVAWNDGPGSATGGGISRVFPLPRYQSHAAVPPSANPDHRSGRGVPDVSGLADPETGAVIITLDGEHLAVLGGTSATAPMWAALAARLGQALGTSLGFANPLLYRFLHYPVLRDVVHGNNGAYAAGPGWDACTGLGSPDGVNLLAAIQIVAAEAQQARAQAEQAEQARQAEGSNTGGPPPPPQPAVPEPTPAGDAGADGAGAGGAGAVPAVARPFLEATEQLQAALADAWTDASSGDHPGTLNPTAFRHEAAAAGAEYVGALLAAWQRVSPGELDPWAIFAIGASLASAGQASASAASIGPAVP